MFRNLQQLLQNEMKVVHCGVRHFVLEMEEYSLGSRHCDAVLALVVVDELPKRMSTVLLFEADCHDLVFLDLRPLYAICMCNMILSLRSKKVLVLTTMSYCMTREGRAM